MGSNTIVQKWWDYTADTTEVNPRQPARDDSPCQVFHTGLTNQTA